ncbi:MAG: hypothetical protein VKO44_04910 [Cyanobacteriota bacterium]|jgi:hypothetical protein|nr:hypothetical protein [Cyanobacteriota bacterium]
MGWDPAVFRKYSTTSHFRLLNQVRSELKASPLPRHPDGELNMAVGRRGGPAYRVPVEVRGASARPAPAMAPVQSPQATEAEDPSAADTTSFRDRLRAVQMR